MHFKYALAHRPDDPDLLFDVAAELAALNRPSEALPLVQSSLSAKSNSVSALMLAGRLHQSLGNPAMALASFEAAAIEAPAEIAPLVEVSQAAELLGDSLRAAAALQSALTLDPDHPSALARCSVLSKRHGEIQDALHYACRAVRSALDRGISHLPGLDILQSLGASRQVEAVYNRALAFWGRQPSVLVRLGEHRLRQGRVREAAAVASELVALDGQCFEFQRLRVRAYVALGDFVMAQASVRDLLARHGGDARAHLLGAQVAEAEWHTEAALAAAQRALSLDPDYLDAHRDAARHALMLLDTDRAARHLDEVPRLMPPHLKRPGYSNRSLQGFARTLLVDYVTNLHALARLRAIPEPDIPSLLELVRQEPGYTAAAITLLVRLQRAGLLSAGRDREGDESAGRSAIPRQIVQYWDAEDPPPDVLDHVASWRDAHPEWTHRLFSDASALSFLEENFSRQVVRAYRAASHASQKADLFRIAYLISRGGYYADVDDLCLSSISSFVPGETELVFAHEYWGSVGNNFLGSVPHHPVMEYALSECVQAILNDNLDSIWLATGPGLITRALAAWLAQSAHDLRGALQRILVLDRHETADRFGPLQPLAYKSTDQHWTAGASWRATPGGHLLRPPFTHADRFS